VPLIYLHPEKDP